MVESLEDKQAIALAEKFIKTGLRGTTEDKIRNKLGNKVWPLAQKITRYGSIACLGIIAAATMVGAPVTFPSLLFVGGGFLADRWAQGHVKFLQNVTLRQAAFFGRQMKNAQIPETVRQKAIEYFLKKESPIFTAQKYIQKNPDMILRLRDGQMAHLNKNFVSIFDENTHALSVRAHKENRSVKFAERMSIYKKSWEQYKQAQTEKQNNFSNSQNGESRLALEEFLKKAQRQKTIPKVQTKEDTLETGRVNQKASSMTLSEKLLSLLNLRIQEKTGSKIISLQELEAQSQENILLRDVWKVLLHKDKGRIKENSIGIEFSSGILSHLSSEKDLKLSASLLNNRLASSR